jgi:hypothetical protein
VKEDIISIIAAIATTAKVTGQGVPIALEEASPSGKNAVPAD